MRKYPATCKKCGSRVDNPSIRCKECGTRIPCPMSFSSYLMAFLWAFPVPFAFILIYMADPPHKLLLSLAVLLPLIPFAIFLLIDKRKARRDAATKADS